MGAPPLRQSVPLSAASGLAPLPLRVLNVSTRCLTLESLSRSFAPFVGADTLFIPASMSVDRGESVKFKLFLKDGQLAIEGAGVVIEVYAQAPGSPHGKPGVLLKVSSLPGRNADLMAAMRRRNGETDATVAQPTPPPVPMPIPPVGARPPRLPPSIANRTIAYAGPKSPPGPPPELRFDDQTVRRSPEELGMPGRGIESPMKGVERTPGAPDQLPANPFSELTTKAVDIFVDVYLVEGADAVPESTEKISDPTRMEVGADLTNPSPALPPPRPRPPAPSLFLPGPAATLADVNLPPPDNVTFGDDLAHGRPSSHPPIVLGHDEDAHDLMTRTGGLRLKFRMAKERLSTKLPRPVRRALPLGLTAIVGIIAGYSVWGGKQPAAPIAAVPTIVTAGPAPTPVVQAPAPTPDPPLAPAKSPIGPAAKAAPPAGSTCTADISSSPKGAAVTLGKKKLGRTPLEDVAIPCAVSHVVLSRPRYETTTETLTPTAGRPAVLVVKLERPRTTVQLSSTPARALLTVNGRAVGTAPRTITVSRFETVRFTAQIPGAKPWKQTIYVKGATLQLHAQIVGTVTKGPNR